jgi:hypothetical protein
VRFTCPPGDEIPSHGLTINVSQSHQSDVLQKKATLFVYGMVKFTDIYRQRREAGFAYAFRIEDTGPDRWVPVGGDAYWRYK